MHHQPERECEGAFEAEKAFRSRNLGRRLLRASFLAGYTALSPYVSLNSRQGLSSDGLWDSASKFSPFTLLMHPPTNSKVQLC